jgi:hypothetical protein
MQLNDPWTTIAAAALDAEHVVRALTAASTSG